MADALARYGVVATAVPSAGAGVATVEDGRGGRHDGA